MKLMDKFHSPKIKRTPSKKGKQLQPEPAVKSTEKPANKVCVFVHVHVKMCVPWESRLFPTFFSNGVYLTICETIVFLLCCFAHRTLLCVCVRACMLVFVCLWVCVCAPFNPLVPTLPPDAAVAGCTAAGAETYIDMNGSGPLPE